MTLNGPATREAIARAGSTLAVRLPADYVGFLLEHNGGEGPVGDEGWGAFHPIEDLPQVQINYAELDHLSASTLDRRRPLIRAGAFGYATSRRCPDQGT
jgi:cell wall assembly regulator SMI1